MSPTALVAGGSSAIGTAVAAELAGLGHEVLLWGRDADRLDRAAAAVRSTGEQAGGRAVSAVVDLTGPDAVDAAVRAAGDALSVVVYAAGQFDWADAEHADPDGWDELLTVNLAAAARVVRRTVPTLLANAPSALVLIGSGAARQAYPHNAAYVASKHGLRALAESVWLEVRDRGVKVSTVSPGLVAAGAALSSPAGHDHPERLLQPADVAAAVRFVVTFPTHGCPTEIRLEPHAPV